MYKDLSALVQFQNSVTEGKLSSFWQKKVPYFELRLESEREVSAIRFAASSIFSLHPKKSYQVMFFRAANTHIPGER